MFLLFLTLCVQPIRFGLESTSTWSKLRTYYTCVGRFNSSNVIIILIYIPIIPPRPHYNRCTRVCFLLAAAELGGKKSATIGGMPPRPRRHVTRVYAPHLCNRYYTLRGRYTSTPSAVVTQCSPRRDTDCSPTDDCWIATTYNCFFFPPISTRKKK